MGKMGRPIEYTAEIWPGILEKISSGASLSGVLREPGMPSYVHAWRMLQADDKLKEAYQKAVDNYYNCFWGNTQFNELLEKYKLKYEWYDTYTAFIYNDDDE